MKLNDGADLELFMGAFNDFCHEARTQRRPILLVSLKNTLEEPVLSAYSALCNGNSTLINESFMAFGVYNDMLSDEQGVQISQHLQLPEGSIMCIWTLFVHYNNTIQINSRLAGTTDSPITPEQLE